MGVAIFQQGDRGRAGQLLKQCLRLTRLLDEPLTAAVALETQAWIAADEGNTQRAAVLLAAAETLGRSVGSSSVHFDTLLPTMSTANGRSTRRSAHKRLQRHNGRVRP